MERAEARDRDLGNGDERAVGRQRAEDGIDMGGQACGIDRADGGDLQAVAAEGGRAHRLQIGLRETIERLKFAAHGRAIRMIGIGVRAKDAACGIIGIVDLALQPRRDLALHAFEGLIVETRLVHAEPQQLEGLVRVAGQRLHAARQNIAIGGEGDFDRIIVEDGMKGARVVRPRAFVENAGEKRGEARLSFRVLRGAALEGEFDRDERHGIVFDKPGLDAGFREHFLHARGARRPGAGVRFQRMGGCCGHGVCPEVSVCHQRGGRRRPFSLRKREEDCINPPAEGNP